MLRINSPAVGIGVALFVSFLGCDGAGGGEVFSGMADAAITRSEQ